MSILWKMPHRVDLCSKSVTESLAGQRVASWVVTQPSVRCEYAPNNAGIFIDATYEAVNSETLCFEAGIDLGYEIRFCNIKDKFGNLISAGPYEVTKIMAEPGFSGKVHHRFVLIKEVTDE